MSEQAGQVFAQTVSMSLLPVQTSMAASEEQSLKWDSLGFEGLKRLESVSFDIESCQEETTVSLEIRKHSATEVYTFSFPPSAQSRISLYEIDDCEALYVRALATTGKLLSYTVLFSPIGQTLLIEAPVKDRLILI